MPIKLGKLQRRVNSAHEQPDEPKLKDSSDRGASGRLRRVGEVVMATETEIAPLGSLTLNPCNAKKHPERQIDLLQESIKKFGFTTPLLVDEKGKVLAGHARYAAAQRAGLTEVPVIRLNHLSAADKRALALADNKLSELGEWDLAILAEELSFLFDATTELSIDPRDLGWSTVEVDQIVVGQPEKDRSAADPADRNIPTLEALATTAIGDIWNCGDHRLVCGDATRGEVHASLMGADEAALVFTDPTYNVLDAGRLTDREGVRERTDGETNSDEFQAVLSAVLLKLRDRMAAGAVAFVCTDWRHLFDLDVAARPLFGDLKDMIVWVKNNAGLGSFYPSQHELVCVYARPGKVPNNVSLGGKARYRTNVWKYPGVNSVRRGRKKALATHPTVKPVAMVADALLDYSNLNDIVIDAFGGSGTTMIAAERTGRRARLIEIDPLYCDVIVTRWQEFAGATARLAETGETFDEVKARRGAGRDVEGDHHD